MRYIIIILLLITINAKAQDLNETIDYINNILKVNHTWLFSSSGTGTPENRGENPSFYFDKIYVDNHGKIDIRNYHTDATTEKVLEDQHVCYGYLKSLIVWHWKGSDWIHNDNGIDHSVYRLNLS